MKKLIAILFTGLVFLSFGGKILKAGNAEETRNETGKSLDQLFKEVFKC